MNPKAEILILIILIAATLVLARSMEGVDLESVARLVTATTLS
jgi:hypothetical protein